MTASQAPPSGRTHWRRLILVMIPTVIVSVMVAGAIAAGAAPVSLAISPQATSLSGQTFQITADTLEGKGFAQYPAIDHTKAGDRPMALSAIGSADLHNLCQSAITRFPGFGAVTLQIRAGGGGKPAHADNLVVNTDDLAGDAVFRNISIGRDASALNGVAGGPAGVFAQQADTVHIDHLRQRADSVTAGTFRLTGLHLAVKSGAEPCS
jgi:hypothetical protein